MYSGDEHYGDDVTSGVVDDCRWCVDFKCLRCGSDDVSSWADDGEADLADWWECNRCHADGAIVDPDDPTRTQNGLPVLRPQPRERR